jgi:hypothetical protein
MKNLDYILSASIGNEAYKGIIKKIFVMIVLCGMKLTKAL